MIDPTRWVYRLTKHDKPRDITLHERERVRSGYSTYDFWNFCDYMAWVNISALKRFKEEGMGYPATLESVEEWNEILDKMIAGFKAHLELNETHTPELLTIKDEGLKLYAEHFSSLWD